MEDDLNILANGTTSIFCQIEDDIKLWKMEINLYIVVKGRRPQYFDK
jgi:hypothetical protein